MPHHAPFLVRPLLPADLPALLRIQLACYGPGFIESADVYGRRLASPANRSLAVERGGALVAYAAAYRSVLGKVTPLHGPFDAPDAPDGAADTLYLHDMAVLPEHAGQGIARALLAHLWRGASDAGLTRGALVSVQDSQGWWARHGYAPCTLADADQVARLASYGAGAVYMVRPGLGP